MKKFLAISGGVGGAKLGLGLTKILSEDQLSFLVNTGDDFKHAGVNISPDIDTLMYTPVSYTHLTLPTIYSV